MTNIYILLTLITAAHMGIASCWGKKSSSLAEWNKKIWNFMFMSKCIHYIRAGNNLQSNACTGKLSMSVMHWYNKYQDNVRHIYSAM